MGAFADWRDRRRQRRTAKRTRHAEQQAAKVAEARGRGDQAALDRIEGRVEGPGGGPDLGG